MWRPHELRGHLAGDSQLENNLVYSDGPQSMLTLGGGPCWVLHPLHQVYNFMVMVIEPAKLPLSPGQ